MKFLIVQTDNGRHLHGSTLSSENIRHICIRFSTKSRKYGLISSNLSVLKRPGLNLYLCRFTILSGAYEIRCDILPPGVYLGQSTSDTKGVPIHNLKM